jgi:transposase
VRPAKLREALAAALSQQQRNAKRRQGARVIAAREDVTIAKSQLSKALRKKGGFRYRRPRHTLKARQDGEAVDRGGLGAS